MELLLQIAALRDCDFFACAPQFIFHLGNTPSSSIRVGGKADYAVDILRQEIEH